VTSWWLPLDFSPETEITGSGILADVPRHVQPPVVSGDQFKCFPPPGVSSNMTIVVECHDLLPDVSSGWNIDLTAEVEYTIHFQPFRRADGTSGDVQHTRLTSESSYFMSLEHVYHASTSRSLVAHNLDLRTTRDLPQLLQRVITQFKNIAALSTAPGQVYMSYRAVPTSQIAQNIENIDRKNIAQVYQAAIVSPKVRCTLSLHQTIGNLLNYRHIAAVHVDHSIRKGRPLLVHRFI
jgi:hypothetical protein